MSDIEVKTYGLLDGNTIIQITTTPVYLADGEMWVKEDGSPITFEDIYGPSGIPYAELTGMDPMPAYGWSTPDGITYYAPPDNTPTPAEANESMRGGFLQQARLAMVPVLMALQLGNATDDESILAKKWQDYYRELQALDTSVVDIVWPVRPEDPV